MTEPVAIIMMFCSLAVACVLFGILFALIEIRNAIVEKKADKP